MVSSYPLYWPSSFPGITPLYSPVSLEGSPCGSSFTEWTSDSLWSITSVSFTLYGWQGKACIKSYFVHCTLVLVQQIWPELLDALEACSGKWRWNKKNIVFFHLLFQLYCASMCICHWGCCEGKFLSIALFSFSKDKWTMTTRHLQMDPNQQGVLMSCRNSV